LDTPLVQLGEPKSLIFQGSERNQQPRFGLVPRKCT
jgi:hypothetical protein